MSKGMKILRAVMLSLLVTICAVAGTVTVLHFTGNGGSGISIRGSDAESGDEDIDTRIPYEPDERFRYWQRALTKSKDTGLYQFYPIIPWNAYPGDTVVLNTSIIGFQGWELDPNFVHVELFDEKTDEDNAYISFIMPETDPGQLISIAALYDEYPYISIENTQNMIAAMNDMVEYGSADEPGGIVVPRPGLPENLGEIYVNERISFYFFEPDQDNDQVIPLKPNHEYYWDWSFERDDLESPEHFTFFNWTALPNGKGGELFLNRPGPEHIRVLDFDVALRQKNIDTQLA